MSGRGPPHGVPTLTEVIELVDVRPPAALGEACSGPQAPASEASDPPLDALPTEAELTARVLADVQRQVELMLEHRVREALMPALLRACDALVLEARTELASVLSELVSRAVAQEIWRHR